MPVSDGEYIHNYASYIKFNQIDAMACEQLYSDIFAWLYSPDMTPYGQLG